MRIGKEVKRDTQLIILSVAVLTIVTLSVSYSAFFSVQSLSTIQEITTGNLDVSVTVDNTNSIINGEEELFPSTIDDITNESTGNYSTLTLLNEGNLDADFSVTVSYDYDKLREVSGYESMSDSELLDYLVPFDYLNVGIYDTTNGNWVNFSESGENLYPAISGLTPTADDKNAYPILRDVVEANMNGTEQYQRVFKIYIWLSDETPITEIGKYVYLNLNVKCAAGTETITETVESIS